MAHLSPQCLRLTEQVRNSCVMRGAAVIVCVNACTQARTCKDSTNRCREHANTHTHTHTHTQNTQPSDIPHSSTRPSPLLLFLTPFIWSSSRLPNTLLQEIRLHNQADSETLVSVRQLWIVLYGGWGHRVKCIAALPHCHFPNWNDRLRHIAPEYRS